MRELFLILLLTQFAFAQTPSGRSLGVGGATDLYELSSDVLHGNPAQLGRESRQKWRLDLPRVSAGATNNAFSVRFWNDNIAQDNYLSASDKRAIMDHIPDDGLHVSGLASVPIAGVVYRQAALKFSEETAVNVTADREIFELALYGNQLNRGYKLNDLGGEQYTLFDAGMAVAYRFEQEYIRGLYGGIGFHFYLGSFYDKITDASGELVTTDSLLTGYGAIQRVHAEQGDGIGFDLGLMAEVNERWSVGLALKQIGSSVTWVVDESTLEAFEIDSAGLIVDSLDDEEYVERAFQASTSVVTGGSFESKLPPTLEASGRFAYSPRVLFLSTLRARLEDSAQGDAGLEASLGGEYSAYGPLVVRAGFGACGPLGTRLAIGGGIRTSRYSLDVGCAWHGGLFNSAKGISLGISHALHW